jgi:hypothetical protein
MLGILTNGPLEEFEKEKTSLIWQYHLNDSNEPNNNNNFEATKQIGYLKKMNYSCTLG